MKPAIRPAPSATHCIVDVDAATVILEALIADRVEPVPCCHADGPSAIARH